MLHNGSSRVFASDQQLLSAGPWATLRSKINLMLMLTPYSSGSQSLQGPRQKTRSVLRPARRAAWFQERRPGLQQARHLFQVSMESVFRGKDDPLFHAARKTAF